MTRRAVSVFALSGLLASVWAGGALAAPDNVPDSYIFSDQNSLISIHLDALERAAADKTGLSATELSFAGAGGPQLDLSALPDIHEVPGMSAARLREATQCTACDPQGAARMTGRPAEIFRDAYVEAAAKGWQAGYAVMAAAADRAPPAAQTANFGSERAYLGFIRRIVRGWQQAVIDIYEADGRLGDDRAARYREAIGGAMLPLAATDRAPLSARFGWASGDELAMRDRWRREARRMEPDAADKVIHEARQVASGLAPMPLLRPEKPAAPAPVDLLPVAQFVSGLAWRHLAPRSLTLGNGKNIGFWARTAGTWKVGHATRRLATSGGVAYPLADNWETGAILTWEETHRAAAASRAALNGRAWLVTPYIAWAPESHTRIRVYGGYGWREDRVENPEGAERYAGEGWLSGAGIRARWKLDEEGRFVFSPSGSLDASRTGVAAYRDGISETRIRKRATGKGRLTVKVAPTEYFAAIEPYSSISSQWRLDRIIYGAAAGEAAATRHFVHAVETGVRLRARALPFSTSLRASLSDADDEEEEVRIGWSFNWPL
ncbi:hypothetical protein FHS78_001091 [Parvibaculum indicum]|uniref:autotransporter domain-containing protein n=1 Tax=Parvibaculum indicum TaxID=562969 RepID=UPI0014219D85|nr:autotransporter domain-containing protein [Parvibaculum indicum]NIJ40815.1 hypothetical protein [Parvibaculum indicum]